MGSTPTPGTGKSDRIGNSTIAITIDTYSHAIPSLDAEAASTVAAQLFGGTPDA